MIEIPENIECKEVKLRKYNIRKLFNLVNPRKLLAFNKSEIVDRLDSYMRSGYYDQPIYNKATGDIKYEQETIDIFHTGKTEKIGDNYGFGRLIANYKDKTLVECILNTKETKILKIINAYKFIN